MSQCQAAEARRRYDETMRIGAARYAAEIQALRVDGLPAEFTQTGGMNFAIEARLEDGGELLITDAEDCLSWDRDEQQGWGVGLYLKDQDGPLVFDTCESNDLDSLRRLVRDVFVQARRAPRG